MDLARDAFVLHGEPGRIDLQAVKSAIAELGFEARFVEQDGDRSLDASTGTDTGPLPTTASAATQITTPPEPVASVLAEARETGRLALVYFHATWCAPCKVIERRVLPDLAVQEALADVLLLKVDTDEHPQAAQAYNVAVMPTLLVLDGEGRPLARMDGPVTAAELVLELARARESSLH